MNNSRTLTIKDVKFSGYYLHMNSNIWGDFQICIIVSLRYLLRYTSGHIACSCIFVLSLECFQNIFCIQCSNAVNTNIHCFLMNFLKNNPTPSKSNHKQVQFGSYNNSVFFGLIWSDKVRLEIYFRFRFEPRQNALQRRYIFTCVSMENTAVPVGQIVKTSLGSYEEEYLCKYQHIDVSNNVTFLISNASFKNVKDIVCDDMGAWKHNGSPLKYFVVDKFFRKY